MVDPFIVDPFQVCDDLEQLTLSEATKACAKVWQEFLARLQSYNLEDEEIDLAVWEIKALSCSVRCRPGSTFRDENDPARETPGMIHFAVKAIEDSQRAVYSQMRDNSVTKKDGYRQLDELDNQFFELISQAVLKAFQASKIQKQFQACAPASRQFCIFATRNDEGLDSSKLTLLWKNKLGLTAEQVRERAIKLSRGSAKKRAVKKSPARLLAEGRTAKAVKKSAAKKKSPAKKSTVGNPAKKVRTTSAGRPTKSVTTSKVVTKVKKASAKKAAKN